MKITLKALEIEMKKHKHRWNHKLIRRDMVMNIVRKLHKNHSR